MTTFDAMTTEEQLREERIYIMVESGLSEQEANAILNQEQLLLFIP